MFDFFYQGWNFIPFLLIGCLEGLLANLEKNFGLCAEGVDIIERIFRHTIFPHIFGRALQLLKKGRELLPLLFRSSFFNFFLGRLKSFRAQLSGIFGGRAVDFCAGAGTWESQEDSEEVEQGMLGVHFSRYPFGFVFIHL